MSQHLTIQRQHFLMFDRMEHPVRKLDLDFLHSTISRFLNDFGSFDQSKDFKTSSPPVTM